jgi:hypothetical protein
MQILIMIILMNTVTGTILVTIIMTMTDTRCIRIEPVVTENGSIGISAASGFFCNTSGRSNS